MSGLLSFQIFLYNSCVYRERRKPFISKSLQSSGSITTEHWPKIQTQGKSRELCVRAFFPESFPGSFLSVLDTDILNLSPRTVLFSSGVRVMQCTPPRLCEISRDDCARLFVGCMPFLSQYISDSTIHQNQVQLGFKCVKVVFSLS